jgi:hypothetical protein
MKKEDYCQCKQPSNVYTNFNNWYEFDCCGNCGKIIEGTFRPLDHYDGEDHVFY